jgi:hypothetical protein
MSAFNILITTQKCDSCGQINERPIQFKYGELWQYKYHIGDKLKWSVKNTEEPKHKEVVVYGISEKCPNCNAEGIEYEILILNGKIASVNRLSKNYDFVKEHRNYIVINE